MAKYVFVTGGVTSSLGKGITAASIGRHPQVPRRLRLRPQARPVHQRRPGDDVALPARRGLRHRRRRRDGPRPGALRALHRREPLAALQRDDRPHLPGRHRQGAPGRLPGRHGPGDPPHHERDQGADPARQPRRRRRRGHRRGGRDGRRHREPAVPRGDPPDAQGRGAPERGLRPRDAAARAPGDRRAQDEADPALRQGAARDRHPARRHHPALGPPGQRRDPREDRPLHRRRRRRPSSRPRPPRRSTRSRSCSRRPAWATSSCATWASARRRRRPTSRPGATSSSGSSAPSRSWRSPSSASTSSCRTPTSRSPSRSSTPAGRTTST